MQRRAPSKHVFIPPIPPRAQPSIFMFIWSIFSSLTKFAKCRDCPYPGCVKRCPAEIPAKAFPTSSVKFPTVNNLAFPSAPQAAKPFRKASAFSRKTALFRLRFLSFWLKSGLFSTKSPFCWLKSFCILADIRLLPTAISVIATKIVVILSETRAILRKIRLIPAEIRVILTAIRVSLSEFRVILSGIRVFSE